MNDETQCPTCGSSNSRVSLTEFKAWGWQPLGNRICGECGTAWRPQCPRWAAVVSIVLGCVMWTVAFALVGLAAQEQGLSNFIDSIVQNQSPEVSKAILVFAVFVLLALWPFLYGIAVLRGRAGKPMILGKVLATPAALEKSEPGSSPLTEGVCAGCQRSVPPGSAYCSHCGRPQSRSNQSKQLL
jgi:hypothetical protein